MNDLDFHLLRSPKVKFDVAVRLPMNGFNSALTRWKKNQICDVNGQIEVSSGALIESNPDLERVYSRLGASTPT